MEIIIQGAIGGAAKLRYPAPDTSSPVVSAIVRDLRRGNNEYPLGQTAYSIELASNGCVFTRCIIVRDVQRSAMGYVAFSVFIPNHEKLSGADVKALLDDFADEYCSRNITDNNFDIGKNDCSFIDALAKKYKSRLYSVSGDDIETIQQDNGKAAFIYYPTNEDLQRYFDDPYQKEYRPFVQILFVSSQFEGKDQNPLNALKHDPISNLTDNIDLDDPKYKLLFNENIGGGVRVEVRLDGNKRYNKNKINRKAELEIIYTKLYYQTRRETGKWYELSQRDIVTVDDYKQTVTVHAVSLLPELKIITFNVKDKKSNPVSGAEIICETKYQKKNTFDNQVAFEGEERKERWKALAKKNNSLGEVEFIPEVQTGEVPLILEEYKKVTITALDEDNSDLIYPIVIQISTKQQPCDGQIEFIGDEIKKKWRITVFDRDNKYDFDSFDFTPADSEESIVRRLKKRQYSNVGEITLKRYRVNPGEHGTLNNDQEIISFQPDGSDVKESIVPNKGYKFIRFDLSGDILIAQYEKVKPFYRKRLFQAGLTTAIILGIFAFFVFHSMRGREVVVSDDSSQTDHQALPAQSQDENKVQESLRYCEGVELNEDTLRNYKKNNCNDTTSNYCQKIDNAIAIRMAINRGKIDSLKNKEYSSGQKQFEDVISGIDDDDKAVISKAMKEASVHTMNLNQVADFITKLQTLLSIDVSDLQESEYDEKIKEIDDSRLSDISVVKNIRKQIEDKKESLKKIMEKPNDKVNPASPKRTIDPPSQTTNEHQSSSNTHESGKSGLENKFWNLVHSGSNDKSSYDDLRQTFINKSPLTSKEKLILSYLIKIHKNPAFEKFKKIDVSKKIQANSLDAIDIN